MKIAYFVLAAILAGIAFLFVRMFSRGELAEKNVYAALQSAELDHRGKGEDLVVYENRDDLPLAGFSGGQRERIWVVLSDVRSNGGLFVIPANGEKKIDCQLVRQLPSSKKIAPEVLSALRSSCR